VITAIAWALFAAVQPVGIVAYIVILTRGGRRDGWGFVVGWVLCALIVMVLTITVAGDVQQSSNSTVAVAGWVQIVLGLLALGVLAVRRIRGPRKEPATPKEPEEPEVSTSEKNAGLVGSAVIAALTQGWPIVAAAVAAVLSATSSGASEVLGMAVVIVVCSSTYLAAQIFSSLYPEATDARLQTLRRRIETNRQTVIDVVLGGVGVWLIANGIIAQLAS
jgi:uncharacterized membrane protein YhaH (DUF805 family)